jgi:hypothetical protein
MRTAKEQRCPGPPRGRPFEPGKSGNPSGRPKSSLSCANWAAPVTASIQPVACTARSVFCCATSAKSVLLFQAQSGCLFLIFRRRATRGRLRTMAQLWDLLNRLEPFHDFRRPIGAQAHSGLQPRSALTSPRSPAPINAARPDSPSGRALPPLALHSIRTTPHCTIIPVNT